MKQVSLNLVAITIFFFVMLSLLTPLIHLPAEIPALAVFAVLCLATVDTLGWQGRGSTLLLDWLARFSKEYRDRVLHHEAGHFLVAHQLGIPITGYTLTAWEARQQGQPGLGGVTFDTQELETELATGQLSTQLIDRYCIVWMAGIAAELLHYGDAEGGGDDRQTIRTLWLQLQRPLSEVDIKQRWAILQAKALLQTNQPAYNALLQVMEQRSSVESCIQAMHGAMAAGT